MDALRTELKMLIIETLNLRGTSPGDIDDEDFLFGEGLGLDSLDALELVVELEHRYGLDNKLEDEANRKAFRSIATLADFITEHRGG